jgi:hypothetical protein
LSETLRESASTGKFLCLSLKVEYVNRLALKNGAARDMPARAREGGTDVLWDRTPVGHRTQVLSIEFENGHVLGFAETPGASDDSLQHCLKLLRRRADDLQNLGGRRLLLARLGEFAGPLVKLLLEVG